MAEQRVQRRLAAILAADVVGYSRLMGEDEAGTLAALKELRAQLIDPTIAEYQGRIVKLMGDGALVEFASVVDAVECAVRIQRDMVERTAGIPESKRITFRIGINLGDVIIDGDDIYGDGVNVAARLEGLAEPGGVCISDVVHQSVAGKLDLAFEDLGEQQLKNIAEPVRTYQVTLNSSSSAPISHVPLPDKPSIAVLPFENLSDDLEQEFFTDGLVEDIITTLSKLSGLLVIARNSSFVYKGRAVDVREVARELGVRYVLEGSVRKGGDRIRISAKLIDADNGSNIWAERYDRTIDDIFAVQDEITLVLATEMQVNLTEGEQARLRYATTDNVEAWTQWAEGLSHYRGPITKDNFGRVRACWERALALDPKSAALNAMLGLIHYVDARFGWWDDRDSALKKGCDYVDTALELDPDNADAHMSLSLLFMVMRRYEDAVVHARSSVELAPGSADAATFGCFVLASSGYPDDAVVQIEKAMTLSPNFPANYLGHLGNAYRLSGRTEEAIAAFMAYDARNPGFGLTDLVIAYQQNDQPDEARQTAERLLAARRDFTIASWQNTQFRSDTAQLEADMDALAAAGLPMS
jgi:adenylate cyclase